jgi:hypothetical protein
LIGKMMGLAGNDGIRNELGRLLGLASQAGLIDERVKTLKLDSAGVASKSDNESE